MSQLGPEFYNKLNGIAKKVGADPNWLIKAMQFESGINSSRVNPHGGATGLIQFTPQTAQGLGTTTLALQHMDPVSQLDYVDKYLSPYAGKIHSAQDLYMSIFSPKYIGASSDQGMYSKGSRSYGQNAGLDLNHDGTITVGEATQKVYGNMPNNKQNNQLAYIPGTKFQMGTDAANALGLAMAEARKHGVNIGINSAYRSDQHQRDMIANPSAYGVTGAIAQPGHSTHNLARGATGVDIANPQAAEPYLKQFGFQWRHYKGDQWHFDYVGGPSNTAIASTTPSPTQVIQPRPQLATTTQVATAPPPPKPATKGQIMIAKADQMGQQRDQQTQQQAQQQAQQQNDERMVAINKEAQDYLKQHTAATKAETDLTKQQVEVANATPNSTETATAPPATETATKPSTTETATTPSTTETATKPSTTETATAPPTEEAKPQTLLGQAGELAKTALGQAASGGDNKGQALANVQAIIAGLQQRAGIGQMPNIEVSQGIPSALNQVQPVQQESAPLIQSLRAASTQQGEDPLTQLKRLSGFA